MHKLQRGGRRTVAIHEPAVVEEEPLRAGWHQLEQLGERAFVAAADEVVKRLEDHKAQPIEGQLVALDRPKHHAWRAAHDVHTRIHLCERTCHIGGRAEADNHTLLRLALDVARPHLV
eukprot:6322315-Prymnesium_polylepis.2